MKEKLPKFFQRVAGTDMLRICMKVPAACRPNLPDQYKVDGKGRAYLIQHLGTSDLREAQRIERRENYIGIFTRLIDAARPKSMKWAYIPPTPEEIQRSLAYVEQSVRENPTDAQKAAQKMIDDYVSGRFTPAIGVYREVPDGGDEKQLIHFDAGVDLWADERKVPDPTRDAYKNRMAELAKHLGHDIAKRVIQEDLITWKDTMVQQGLALKTIRNYLGYVTTVFKYLYENKRIDRNPNDPAIRIIVKRDGRKTRREFEDEHRAAIYRATLEETRPLYRWANLLMLFSGMRGHEFAEADTRDIRQIDGVWCLLVDYDYRTQDNETLKTDESIRKIPLHRAVLDAGFLKYVHGLPAGPLFPMLIPDRKYGRRRGDLSRKLGTWLRETVGIKDKRRVNHSHRHSVETLMCAAGVPKRVAFAVTGHAAQSEGDKYIHPTVKMLKRAVEKIPVPKLKAAEPSRRDPRRSQAVDQQPAAPVYDSGQYAAVSAVPKKRRLRPEYGSLTATLSDDRPLNPRAD